MNIVILGSDGYLGSATKAYLEKKGHRVVGIDSGWKRSQLRNNALWHSDEPNHITFDMGSRDPFARLSGGEGSEILAACLTTADAVIHYAEQPSAGYSMMNYENAASTLDMNVHGTYELIHALIQHNPSCHVVKLGTMGEYGTPGIDIPEGWTTIEDEGGRTYRGMFPKLPGSFYHLTKVMDSDMLHFSSRIWGLRVTDLNQGVVYGCRTDEISTNFYYDSIHGTCLNRFIAQAACNLPLTVYGLGNQTRGWLNILDTLQCVELALENPPDNGEMVIRNQFTEIWSVSDLAEMVAEVTGAKIHHVENPRKEMEDHYYNASNQSFLDLGLDARPLTDAVVHEMYEIIEAQKHDINPDLLDVDYEQRWQK